MTTTLERELERRALRALRDLVRIVPAGLGVNAPLIGEAELAFEALLTDPSLWRARRVGRTERASA